MTTPTTAIIMTFSGKLVDLLDFTPDDVDIRDVAHHLAHICRFTGASRDFYSVAQHCCLVAQMVPDHLKLHALLHDAAEAYVGDVSSPLKRALGTVYTDIEQRVQSAIEAALIPERVRHIPDEDRQWIKAADRRALTIEAQALMRPSQTYWPAYDVRTHSQIFEGSLTEIWPPTTAKIEYRLVYAEWAIALS